VQLILTLALALRVLAGSVFEEEEQCDEDTAALLQLHRSSGGTAGAPKLVPAAKEEDEAITLNASTALAESYIQTFEAVPSALRLDRWLLEALAWPQLAAHLALAIFAALILSEGLPSRFSFLQGRVAASVLAALSFVGANTYCKVSMEVYQAGVMDLIYMQSLTLAMAGLLLFRIHPSRPRILPGGADQNTVAIAATFFWVTSTMLGLAGLLFAPAPLVVLAMAIQPGLVTILKQICARERVQPEESYCSVGLLLSVLPLVAHARSTGPESWLVGIFLGFLSALLRAAACLLQRSLCGRLHHTAFVVWSGVLSLLICCPVALTFPEQIKVMVNLQAPQVAPLLAASAFGLSFSLNLSKAANSGCGLHAESGYLLVAGLSSCIQFVLDLPGGGDRFGVEGQISLILIQTFIVLSYIVSERQLIKAEECVEQIRRLHLEPQSFE